MKKSRRDLSIHMKQKLLNMKNILVSLSAVAAICVAAVVVMLVTKDEEAYRTIKVIEISGDVSVIKGDKEYAAYVGMVLEEGYKLETLADSYVRMVLDDDKYVKIEAESKVTFEALGKSGTNKTKIRIDQGAMTCEIVNPLKEDDDFTINTPNAVLAVRGTFFRVDLNFYGDGLVKTKVITYGGRVSTQRVMSTGEYVGEEVDVEAGNKVIISQINEEEDNGSVYEDVIYEKDIAKVEDIPDDDLVDVYFAIENGHEMFVDIDTVSDVLEERDINIDEYTSVYEKAKSVIDSSGVGAEDPNSTEGPTTEGPTTEGPTTEEPTTEEPTTEEPTTEEPTTEEPTTEEPTTEEPTTEESTTEETTTEEPTTEEPTTEEPTTEHTHTEQLGAEAGIHKKCSECGEVIEDGSYHDYDEEVILAATCKSKGEKKYTCSCGYSYTEEIDYLDHNGVYAGEKDVHIACDECGEVIENGSFHEYSTEATKVPSCTETGIRTYTCGCGYSYTEEIPMEDHTEVDGAETGIHTKCSECGEIIEDGSYHSYEQEETLAATCTSKGEMTYTCSCGHTYTEEIDYLDHNSVYAAEEDAHRKCDSCGEVLENGSYHEYSSEATKVPSCTETGIRTYTCECGHSYTEDIPMESHTEVDGAEADVHVKCGVCGEVIEDGTYHNYSAEETLAATCTTVGEKTYSCSCGHTYTEEIAALGHKKSDESAGSTTCARCGLAWVDISESNFEDEALRNALAEYDADEDGCLIGTELTSITTVNVAGTADADGGCKSLSGVELLPNVTVIDCSYNGELATIDLSNNKKMYKLICNNTGVESINMSGCSNLYELNFSECSSLTSLNVSSTSLEGLVINSNPLMDTLDVSNTNMRTISISGANFTTFGIEGLPYLTHVSISDTPVQSVLIKDTSISIELALSGLTQLESVTTTNSTIYEVNVDDCVALKTLSVPNSGATVSFENVTQIETLNLSGTKTYSLQLPGATYTKLTTLDISGCDSFQSLDVSGCTSLTSLNITDNPMLSSVNASDTGISAIDLTGSSFLGELNLNSTQIEDMANVVVPSDSMLYNLNIGSKDSYDINLSFDTGDISWFSKLMSLDITNAKISDADWTTIKSALSTDNLGTLKISGNSSTNSGYGGDYLMKLDLSGFTNLRQLEASGLTDVTEIDISDSAINMMDFSQYTDLIILNTSNSALMDLDVSSNELLETIDVSQSTSLKSIVMNDDTKAYALYALDVTGCSALESIALAGCNNITSLDVSGATNLMSLGLNSCTGITELDLSNMTSLTTVSLAVCNNLQTINLSNTSVDMLVLIGCTAVTSVDVTGISNSSNAIEVDITGTTIDESIFTKSDGFTVNLVTQ